MSCEREGHVGCEDAGNPPKFRCLYCGSRGYRDQWSDGCCEFDGEEETPDGVKIYPEECDHECHMTDEDEQKEMAL